MEGQNAGISELKAEDSREVSGPTFQVPGPLSEYRDCRERQPNQVGPSNEMGEIVCRAVSKACLIRRSSLSLSDGLVKASQHDHCGGG